MTSVKQIKELLETLDLSELTNDRGELYPMQNSKGGLYGYTRSYGSQQVLQARCCEEDDDPPKFTDEGKAQVGRIVLEHFKELKDDIYIWIEEEEKYWFSVTVELKQ